MKLEQAFEVKAPLDQVWDALVDVERVAPCLPGAEVTGRNDDGSYEGSFKVKIGPTAAAYTGKLHMDAIDEGSHTATMHAQGTDRRGQGGAKATIVSSVVDAGGGTTHVNVVTDYHITGRLARFGRGGMIEEISNRLLNEFAKSLQQMLAGDGQPPAAADTTTDTAADTTTETAAGTTTETAAESAPAPAGPPTPEPAPAAEAPAAEAPATSPAAEAAAAAEPASVVPESDTAAQPTPPSPPATDGSPFPGATPPPPATSEPMDGLSLVGGAMWSRVKKNPAPVVALVLGFLLALRVLRRRG
jgi:uncharacterized protein